MLDADLRPATHGLQRNNSQNNTLLSVILLRVLSIFSLQSFSVPCSPSLIADPT